MLRAREEEMSQSSLRGRGLLYGGAGHLTDEDEDKDEEEEGFSESELELYKQYKAAGFRDLVSNTFCPIRCQRATSCSVMLFPVYRCGTARRTRTLSQTP